jgi:hypothetical protein
VFDLHQRLLRAGFHVNPKRLYRLADARPIHHIDLNIAGAICRELAIGLEELVQFEQPDFVLEQLDTALQYRLDELLTKKNSGRLAEDEEETLDGLLEKSRDITRRNAKILAAQSPGWPRKRSEATPKRRSSARVRGIEAGSKSLS